MWTQVANLNTRRNFHTTLAFDNKALYVVAGFNGGQRTNLIEKFDLKERNHWETLNLKILIFFITVFRLILQDPFHILKI